MSLEPRLERCDRKTDSRGYREAPEHEGIPDQLSLCDDTKGERAADWVCRQISTTAREHQYFFRCVDFVRVTELYGYRLADQIVERMVHNREIMRTA